MTRSVEDFPKGFPRLACFLDSDDSFMLYRRFGTVFSRLLLNKQDEMRELEGLLQGMDKTDESSGKSEYLMSRTEDVNRADDIPTAWPESRTQLMQKLEEKALQYGKTNSSREIFIH